MANFPFSLLLKAQCSTSVQNLVIQPFEFKLRYNTYCFLGVAGYNVGGCRAYQLNGHDWCWSMLPLPWLMNYTPAQIVRLFVLFSPAFIACATRIIHDISNLFMHHPSHLPFQCYQKPFERWLSASCVECSRSCLILCHIAVAGDLTLHDSWANLWC